MRKVLLAAVAALALGAVIGRPGPAVLSPQQAPPPVPEGGYLNAYISLLRSDLRAKKQGIVTESLRLNGKEAEVFWPIYRRYESDLTKFNDARLKLIKDYADSYDRMTDAKARELVERMFALEEQRVSLKKAYYKQLEKALPGKTVARFFQVERRIDLMIDLKIAAEVPIVE